MSLARVADFVNVSDFEMSMLGGVVLHAGVVPHLFGIFLHVVRGLIRNDAFGFDGLIDVRGQINRAVRVNFPSTAVIGG